MSPMRRFFLSIALAVAVAVVLVGAQPARADEVVIDLHPGTGADPLLGVRNPQAVLDRGGTVDGLPVRRAGAVHVIAWSAMRHLVFIPGDIPTVIITHRDRSETMLDVEPCRIVSGDMDFDIHDVAEIAVR